MIARLKGSGTARFLIAVAAYLATSIVGRQFIAQPEGFAVIWPAAGLAFGMLAAAPRPQWPALVAAIATGNLLANALTGTGMAIAGGFAILNTGEAVLGALAYWTLRGTDDRLRTRRGIAAFIGGSVIAANLVTAALGAIFINVAFGAPILDAGVAWFVADGTGILAVGSLILVWSKPPTVALTRRAMLHAALVTSVLAGVCIVVFLGDVHPLAHRLPLALVLPVLLWAAVRYGAHGATAAVVTAASLAALGALNGLGPFSDLVSLADRAAHVQFLVVAAYVPTMLTGAYADASRRDRRSLEAANDALRRAGATLDAAEDGFFIFDPASLRFSHVNRGAVTQTGHGQAALLAMTPVDIQPEFDEAEFRVMLQPLIDGSVASHRYMTVHRRADGTEVPVEIVLQQVGQAADPPQMVAISRDITARLEAEAARDRSERRFRELLEAAPDGMVGVDTDGRIVFVNQQLRAIFGADAQELLGEPLERLLPEEARGVHVGHRAAFSAEPVPRPMGSGLRIRARRLDGSTFPADVSLSSVNTDEGRLHLAVVRDVTERERLNQEVRDLDLRYRAAAGGSPDGFYVFAPVREPAGGVVDYVLVDANPVAAARMGLGVAEAAGQRAAACFPEWAATVVDRFAEVARTGSGFEEVVETHRSGASSSRWYRHQVAPAADGVAVTSLEITDRVTAERRLQTAANELEAINRDLREFASVVSHDLQAPLRRLQTFSDLLEERAASRLDEQGADYLGRIRTGAQRMQVLVRDLLAYARVGQTRPVGRPIDLERHVQASLAALSDEIRDARATVRIGELPWVEADPVLLDQVLENILSNALKFRRPGVRHKVTISGDRSRGDDGRSWTRLVVEDNGIGFDPDYTDRIFEMFERLGDRKAYEGTGVGLAIVRRIVERLEGHVAAEGRPGRGSTFTILLPAADRLEEAA